ncbi:MAG: hypothetical protein OEY14_02170 [Myxococcales bacterium]|nr:hypothetical protein [Myxococcales bacterium]
MHHELAIFAGMTRRIGGDERIPSAARRDPESLLARSEARLLRPGQAMSAAFRGHLV